MDRKSAALLVVCGAGLIAAWGPLDPPDGPIASTYKTLTEVEPRIAVNAANTPGDAGTLFKITKPGSYYLAGNITGASGKAGILITASDVTLDLCGFSLRGVQGATQGVWIDSVTSVTVRNGTVTGWVNGIIVSAEASRLENLTATSNSALGFNIDAGCIVVACASRNNQSGFWASASGVFRDCIASENSEYGFKLDGATAAGCTSRGNTKSGFYANNGTAITDSVAEGNADPGFLLDDASRAARCTSRLNLEGFRLFNTSSIVECAAGVNTTDGARILDSANTVERCTLNGNGRHGLNMEAGRGNNLDGNQCMYNDGMGIVSTDPDNLFVRNRSRGNPQGDYSIEAGSDYGVILTNPGQGFSSSAAWANFAY